MSKPNEMLGGRIPLAEPSTLTPSQLSLYEAIDKKAIPWSEASGFVAQLGDGRLVGPFNIVLQSPELGTAFLELQGAEEKMTSLSERTRQVVILTVGSVWKAVYELYAHSAVARTAGLTDDAIEALARGDLASGLSDQERLAQLFTHQLVLERTISLEIFDQAKTLFGIRGIVDMIVLVGTYETVCSLLNTFDVPVPEH